MGRYLQYLLMEFCVHSIFQPEEIVIVLGYFFALTQLCHLWQNIRVCYLKWKTGAILTVLVHRGVWTLPVSFMVKNESTEGKMKSLFYFSFTYASPSGMFRLHLHWRNQTVAEFEPWTPVNPTTYLFLFGSISHIFLPLCKANLQLAVACLHRNPLASLSPRFRLWFAFIHQYRQHIKDLAQYFTDLCHTFLC